MASIMASGWVSVSGRSDAFSMSSRREEDDEEALMWAALERQSSRATSEASEIDVENLGLGEKRKLMERLVRVVEEDNEKFLLKLKNRLERVGIENPTIEVRFENLDVSAEAYLGKRAVPTFFNFFTNKIEGILNSLYILPSRKQPINILNDVSGIIKPSRMCLLLGPPRSGKTTLLLALAGKLGPDLKVSGKVTYNGHEMNEFVPQRNSAYISQDDVHLGEMTVRETLAFSARCQGTGTRYEMLTELSRREKAEHIKPDPDIDMFMKATSNKGQETVITDYILKLVEGTYNFVTDPLQLQILGLDICADTLVGNAMLRGISGGQKKRVTTGEMLVGPSRALFMDEISTGLDSSTTFQIVNSLRQSVHILGSTALVALLQPAPETYDLFDDILLLSEGQIVYLGPRNDVLAFFESMGFRCPERKGVADFLQEVTSKKDQQQYWERKDEPYCFIPVKEFAKAYWSFRVGRQLAEELSNPFDKNRNHPAALTTSRYGIDRKELLKACIAREFILMKRNSFVYIFKMFQLVVISLIAMTVFFRVKMHHDNSGGLVYMGALFIGLLTHLFNGLAELAMSIAKLPVFYKQRDLLFFPAWVYAMPTWIIKIPISFLECAVYTGMTYYVIGFDPSIQRMFKQLFLLTLVSQMASALCRFVASIGRTMVVANVFSSFAQLVFIVLGGFVLSRKNITKWWIWGYWTSPLMYAQNALAVNEFLGKKWQNLIASNKTLGIELLESRGLFPEAKWFWIGAGALIGYIIAFNVIFTACLTYLNPIGVGQTVISEEALEEKHTNIIGQVVKLLSRGRKSSQRSEGFAREVETNISKNKKKGLVLPFSPLSFTFDDITYSIDMPQEMKAQGVTENKLVLLKGVSGVFRPGVLTALMGVSGVFRPGVLMALEYRNHKRDR